ncbi:FeoA family protein [Corynebacterium pacaense]|uniref:FeoA family protein n=1 Tax=Corynebacterium pacaense TaxID=1816684 RepID=UPI0009BA7D56|nr:ferrous iron transport protein A [Corynebacterium pacaense]
MLIPSRNRGKSSWPSLADVPRGAEATLVRSHTEPALRSRLAELGMRPGTTITVVQRTSGGGRVVDTGISRYAIDRETLRMMEVRR